MSGSEPIREFGITRENEERRDGGCAIIFDPSRQRFAVGKRASKGTYALYGGGVEQGEDMQEGILREVREESGLHDFLSVEKLAEALTHYFHSMKKVNRVAHAVCLLAILKSDDQLPVALEEHEDFTLTWVTAQEMLDNWNERNANHDYDHWVYFLEKAVQRLKEMAPERGVIPGGIAILYRQGASGREFLVVENAKTGNISFVSGSQEDSDTSTEEGMRRELEEELGVSRAAIALQPTGVRHEFVFGPNKPERAGHPGSYQVFLADVTQMSDSIAHTKELRNIRWLRKEEVAETLSFPDLRDVFLRATRDL